MLLKYIFYLTLIFSIKLYAINIPQIENNPEMFKVIKDKLKKAADTDTFFTEIDELERWGISPHLFINKNDLKKAVVNKITNGDWFVINDLKRLGYELLDVIQIDDLQKVLQIGFYKIFEEGEAQYYIKHYTDLSKKYNIPLIISPEKLNEVYFKGISNIVSTYSYEVAFDIQEFLNLLKDYGIEVPSETLTKAICNGILNYLKEHEFKICDIYDNIEDINRILRLNINLKNISDIKEILIKHIEEQDNILDICKMLEDAEFIGIDLDPPIFKKPEIIQKLLHNSIIWSFFSHDLETLYLSLLNFSHKYKFDFDISKMSEAYINELKFCISNADLKGIELALTWAKENNLILKLSSIPNIKQYFENGIFEEFMESSSTNKMINFAKNNNIDVDFSKILKDNIILEISDGNFNRVNKIIKKAKNLGINIQLTDLPEIKNAFFEHLSSLFKRYYKNNSSIINTFNFAKENEISLEDLVEKALFKAIKNIIAEGCCIYNNIKDFYDLINNVLKIDLELSKIPNIKEAFYEGLEKTKDRVFANEYLKQLAIVNSIDLELED